MSRCCGQQVLTANEDCDGDVGHCVCIRSVIQVVILHQYVHRESEGSNSHHPQSKGENEEKNLRDCQQAVHFKHKAITLQIKSFSTKKQTSLTMNSIEMSSSIKERYGYLISKC